MGKTNLSSWALKHQNLVLYFFVLIIILGIWGYTKLGQAEDPPFTFKVMLVQVRWPGASALEIEKEVVNRIEKVVMETPYVSDVRSYSMPTSANIMVIGRDSAESKYMPDMFYQVRKRVQDIKATLPQGVQGPFFNDEFGDTFGNIYSLSGDGFSMAQLRDAADQIRKELLRVPSVAKVLLIGEQAERVYIQLSNAKAANLGITLQQLQTTLAKQNAVVATGEYELSSDRIIVNPTGRFTDVDSIRNLPLQIGTQTLKLRDVAEVIRGYSDPPTELFRYMGKPSLGIGVSMQQGGDIIQLGKNLEATMQRIQNQLPLGMDIRDVNNQPVAVKDSINEFTQSVFEAVVIVLGVSFLSLGLRAGAVVAFSIPLVLAGTFFCMFLFNIGLHKISLGSLILALGLLVDDAIIAVEMMARKLEEGFDRLTAASFAYSTTAFPMLSGTLVTVAGFLPIATAKSATGEYTRAIFEVVSIALILSWFAAVIIVPWLGYHLLKITPHSEREHNKKSGLLGKIQGAEHKMTDGFSNWFRRLINRCVNYPKTVILITLLVFTSSVFGFKLVQQQFFPDSIRLELLVDLKLPEGASIEATKQNVNRVEQYLTTQTEHIENFVSYVGTGSPRFYLPLDQQLPNPSFAQFVITTKGIPDREALRSKLIALMDSEQFSQLRGRVLRLENGPPVGYPVQFRVSGDDLWQLRHLAEQVATYMRVNPNLRNVHLDWNELRKSVRLQVDANKAIALGITQSDINQALSSTLQGAAVGEFLQGDQAIPIMVRGDTNDRNNIEALASLTIPTTNGKSVPISQIAHLENVQEEGLIWHRNRVPTITVKGDIYSTVQAPTVTNEIMARISQDKFVENLPLGYNFAIGGSVEESAKGGASIAAGMPLFIIAVLTILMLQLQSFQRVVMVVLTAPFGLIGVTAFLLLFNKPFGFVAMLGTIALSGMIMRNSVILVDQIDRNIEDGMIPHQAVVDAAVKRFRPIMLTAMAAILAMIPLSKSVFFGPMAVAIMGGLLGATLLTLLFLPALYTLWFKLTRGKKAFEELPQQVLN
ncbi:efflux RND transporter permease subunit [uncultured Thiothrix sp.]|uniref:efflux RND transporter permease subunit n=1 Tax=uncultured Thiothrix sp. TaxID=223185 RepID=UPI0026094740|nr:efflux RND transporter permease subunit [uncultured Thiothrix sp.]HMT91716.1 efflux RND transporter permease subunit [Thiolinea sp.]